ncbi:MAG: glutamate--cysteine ligase [Candidatus Midichloriaceae bacterium]|jgi:glutamate--cysteine ligase
MKKMMQNIKKESDITIDLNSYIAEKRNQINDWLDNRVKTNSSVIYSSVDIRNSGFKSAAVDTNLFPAGFNNLSKASIELASKYFREFIDKKSTSSKKIAVYVESFSRNIRYWESLNSLLMIISEANYEVKIITFNEELKKDMNDIDSTIKIHLAKKCGGNLLVEGDWMPDVVILNNDIMENAPDQLLNVNNIVLPNIKYGWYNRKKSNHFEHYNEIAEDFSKDFDIDPWLISTFFTKSNKVNFKNEEGLDDLAHKIDSLLLKIRRKYDEYAISDTPTVFVKANSGTFGRGVISVNSGDQILHLNKKRRANLNNIRSGIINSEVIIQEGINTIEKFKQYPAENITYSMNSKVIGKFIRYNTEKGISNNLNSKGMFFNESNEEVTETENLISRIANIAASHELL